MSTTQQGKATYGRVGNQIEDATRKTRCLYRQLTLGSEETPQQFLVLGDTPALDCVIVTTSPKCLEMKIQSTKAVQGPNTQESILTMCSYQFVITPLFITFLLFSHHLCLSVFENQPVQREVCISECVARQNSVSLPARRIQCEHPQVCLVILYSS